MEDDSLLSVFLSWLPMLLLIAVWVYFMRKGGFGGAQQKYMREHIEETRRQNQALERIAASLEKR